jgi:hypothetical protein
MTKTWESIKKDMASYKDSYSKGGLNYLLHDYGDKGLIIGFKQYAGSNQQIITVGGKAIYNSDDYDLEHDLSDAKFIEIIKKSLNKKKLFNKRQYRVEYANVVGSGTFVEDYPSKVEAQKRYNVLKRDKNIIPARLKLRLLG